MKSKSSAVLVLMLASVLAFGNGCSKQTRAERHLARGVQNAAADAMDLAEKEYQAALALIPDHPKALGKLGILYFQQGRIVPAYLILERAAKAAPEDLEVRLVFGLIANSLARTAGAREA